MSRRAVRVDLSRVPDSTLEHLRGAIASDRLRMPITRAALLDQGIQHQHEALEGALSGHSAPACLAILDTVLAERRAGKRPPPELVWSGPERSNSTARDTAVVLRALFERAQKQVILAGYDFTRGSSLLEPLWIAMRDRGVEARFFVHIEQTAQVLSDEAAYANGKVRDLITQIWPFGEPRPHVCYDARRVPAATLVQHACKMRGRGRHGGTHHQRQLHAARARAEHRMWCAPRG